MTEKRDNHLKGSRRLGRANMEHVSQSRLDRAKVALVRQRGIGRANMARIRQSGPDYGFKADSGLDFEVRVHKTF